jgi:hypothetical protein
MRYGHDDSVRAKPIAGRCPWSLGKRACPAYRGTMPRSIRAAFQNASRSAQLAPLLFVVACVPAPAPRVPTKRSAEEIARVAVASANLDACALEPGKERAVEIVATFNREGRIDSLTIQRDKDDGATLEEPLRACMMQAVKAVTVAPFDSWQGTVEVRTTVKGTASGQAGWIFNRGAMASALGGVDLSACAPLDGASDGHLLIEFLTTGRVLGAHLDGGPSKGSPAATCIEAAFSKARIPPFVSDGGKSIKVGKQFSL